jgi:hypothetical protein
MMGRWVSHGLGVGPPIDPQSRSGTTLQARLKLLNMRDFQPLSGFPSQPKRATIARSQTGEIIGLANPQTRVLKPKRAIGRAKFRAYMQLIHR